MDQVLLPEPLLTAPMVRLLHPPISNFGYAGDWSDPDTGFTYLRNRWLDVSTGTFLSEDPIAQITGNLFGYSNGNPLLQIDPLGLFSLNPLDWAKEQIINPLVNQVKENVLIPAISVTKTVGDSINTAANWVKENPDHVSFILTNVSLVASFIPGGQPVALIAGLLSVGFGVIATKNEINKCTNPNPAQAGCNPGNIALSALGTTTGAAGMAGRGILKAGIALKDMNTLVNVENMSVIATWESELIWAANSAYSYQRNCRNEKE